MALIIESINCLALHDQCNQRLLKDQLELQLSTRQNREIDAIFQSLQLNSVAD